VSLTIPQMITQSLVVDGDDRLSNSKAVNRISCMYTENKWLVWCNIETPMVILDNLGHYHQMMLYIITEIIGQ
jgi:hypothetical protein